MTEIDVSRFVDAQRADFDRALAEIAGGRKRSHWIWYVFPQIVGLGSSPMAVRYGIGSAAEARAFLDHPVLGPNYRRIVAAVGAQVRAGVGLDRLLGWPDDAKLVSSLTLFAGVADPDDPLRPAVGEIFELDGRSPCPATLAFLDAV
jgi:uncharacterized protein (DUF1810 family)